MRVTATAILFALLGLTALTTNANAYWTSDIGNTRPAHAVKQHWEHSAAQYATAHERRFVWHSGGGYTCEWARSVGLYCGCYAAHSLGIPVDQYGVYNGINLKRADAWAAFPHVPLDQANAVIWPGRHVAHLLSHSGKNLTIDDNIGVRTVPIQRGMIFVSANGGIKYSDGTRSHAARRKHYAGA
jgi:hypothetical protein